MRYPLLAMFTLIAACVGEIPTQPPEVPSVAKGGRPGGGGTGGIVPVTLVNNRSLNCDRSAADAISNGSVSYVAGDCIRANLPVPLLWSAANGAVVLTATPGGMGGQAVANDGTLFGSTDGFRPFYRRPGGPMTLLPLPAGRPGGDISDVTEDGSTAVGSAHVGLSTEFVVWTWSGSSWSIAALPGAFAALDGDGDRGVGFADRQAVAWTRTGGGWASEPLPGGDAVSWRGYAMNATGTAIAGTRTRTLASDPGVQFDEPAVWRVGESGLWALEPLSGFTFSEGSANSVETLNDGRVVVVGWLWEDQPGGTERRWAVAWVQPAGATSFGPPIKLAPLATEGAAVAHGVNVRGEIVGTSNAKGLTTAAVMWRLP